MNFIPPKTSRGYFFERRKAARQSSVSVLSASYNYADYLSDVKTIIHPFWVLDYTYSDCGSCRVGRRNNAWLGRPSGHMHLYAPNTRYWEDTSSAPRPLLSSYIAFYGGAELELVKHVNNGDGFGRFIDKTGKAGELLAEAASEAGRERENSYWKVMSKLYEIIDLIHSAQPSGEGNEKVILPPENDVGRSRETIFIEAVQKYLHEHANENVSIADLAKNLNTSGSTISHKYRELTGESPMSTLTTFRINAVKNLLAKGESIKSIATLTGFYDEFHLSKVFKKETGTSPSKYLKRA